MSSSSPPVPPSGAPASRDPPPPPQCRFCLESAPVEDLLSPCDCAGSAQYVHRACLRRWQSATALAACRSGREDEWRHRRCTACRAEFSVRPPTQLELLCHRSVRLLSHLGFLSC